jgi:hypothetical protein
MNETPRAGLVIGRPVTVPAQPMHHRSKEFTGHQPKLHPD